MNERLRSLFLLHFIVFILGFTGILGKLITLPANQLVWFRMAIAAVSIGTYIFIRKKSFSLSPGRILPVVLVGGIIALHWITFFESIKVSNVSIALACFSSGSLFTALLEPLFFRRKIEKFELLFGFAVIAALFLIFKFETGYQLGIALSVLSAALSSLFTVLNGLFVRTEPAETVSFYEMGSGFLILTLYLVFSGWPSAMLGQVPVTDLLYLLLLGIVCTGFAFVAAIHVMKVLSPFTVSLSINLEPVYSIILAFFIFDEHKYLTTEFFIGAFLILCTVIFNAILKQRMRQRAAGHASPGINA